jgi:hypothetical protein
MSATSQQIEMIAKRVLRDLSPSDAVSQTNLFLARVMAAGNLEETIAVEEHFGKSALREVLRDPPSKIFDRQSWNYWHLVFKLPTPDKPDSFFTIYPWFRNRTLGIREPLTAEVINRRTTYDTDPVRSCDEQ